MTKNKYDILGVGVACVDDIIYVKRFPKPNEKQTVMEKTRQGGGLTGTALVAASRLGCSCALTITLGKDDISKFVRTSLSSEGIKLFENPDAENAKPFHSVIVTEMGTGERSILCDEARTSPPFIGEKELELAAKAKCLFVDHVFAPHLIEVTKKARDAGVAVVGDFERDEKSVHELMDLTDHVIIPLAYAATAVDETLPDEAVKAMLRVPGRELACVTDSERGCWYGVHDKPDAVVYQPAFKQEHVVDTTGCGDVFHGVYAASLVQGFPPAERIRRAAAAACIKAGKQGAQAGAPTTAELEAFLAQA